MPDEESPPVIALPLVWVAIEDADARAANQLIVQQHEGEFILTFGHVTPPLLIGTPEENAAQAKTIPYVPVRVVAQITITPGKIGEFIETMQKVLDGYLAQEEA